MSEPVAVQRDLHQMQDYIQQVLAFDVAADRHAAHPHLLDRLFHLLRSEIGMLQRDRGEFAVALRSALPRPALPRASLLARGAQRLAQARGRGDPDEQEGGEPLDCFSFRGDPRSVHGWS